LWKSPTIRLRLLLQLCYYETLTVIHKDFSITLGRLYAIYEDFMKQQELWEKTLSLLKSEISEAALKTWFSKTKLNPLGENAYEVVCPNSFAKTKIDTIYKERIREIVSSLVGTETNLTVSVSKVREGSVKNEELEERPLLKTLEKGATPTPRTTSSRPQYIANLSPHYTLENFVVGSNNRLAFAMAVAVAKSPGANTNNPFFLYASVGLGKTHLVQAVGNEVIRKFPSLRVLYTTSENFTNELIESIQHRTQNSFRKKFRDVDVLVIDDVQFIAGRESTQEEFFNTFNALYLSQKQIVITSDRHPKEITRLEQRLTSRFGGGIMADIQNPDFETRLAILQTKAQNLNLKISSEILEVLSGSVETNIRELEGGLKQVVNLMLSQNGEVSLNQVKDLFQERYYSLQDKPLDPKKVVATICDYFGLRESELMGKRRTQALVRPRQIAMYFLRIICKLPLMKVGEVLGGKDHTTVMHGVSKIEKELTTNPLTKQELIQIQKRLTDNP